MTRSADSTDDASGVEAHARGVPSSLPSRVSRAGPQVIMEGCIRDHVFGELNNVPVRIDGIAHDTTGENGMDDTVFRLD